mmetsp:Transcript_24396/g.54976  ORF Transcript_24396/g.54976 Transcript_24396/m.54976 type:complete len:254 (-) Transcript_24396:549-1310(-)
MRRVLRDVGEVLEDHSDDEVEERSLAHELEADEEQVRQPGRGPAVSERKLLPLVAVDVRGVEAGSAGGGLDLGVFQQLLPLVPSEDLQAGHERAGEALEVGGRAQPTSSPGDAEELYSKRGEHDEDEEDEGRDAGELGEGLEQSLQDLVDGSEDAHHLNDSEEAKGFGELHELPAARCVADAQGEGDDEVKDTEDVLEEMAEAESEEGEDNFDEKLHVEEEVLGGDHPVEGGGGVGMLHGHEDDVDGDASNGE